MGMGTMALRLVAAVGIFFCVLTAVAAWHSGKALWLSPSKPVSTTVARAPDSGWVVLEDAVLDCSTEHVHARSRTLPAYTLVRATDRDGAHGFIAQLDGPHACAEARGKPLEGAFVGRFSRMFLAVRQNFPLPPGEDVAVFSQFEAPRYLKRALGWWLTWFGVSLLVTMLTVSALWAKEPPAPPVQRQPTKSGRLPTRD